MKVLIVDDSPDALALAKARLGKDGHELICTSGGKAGLEMASRERPDLILLDVDMPEMSGFDVIRRLKADGELCMIPVIFLSGSGGPEDKVKGLNLGAVDYVAKPFDVFELRARVNAALRTKHLQDLLIEHARIDPLTGLANRRGLAERLQQDWAHLQRHGGPLSFVMADIDHFKGINDRFGHPVGDEVLCQVSRLLAAGCRESDTLARYGGEEFAVIARHAAAGTAEELAQRLRTGICSQALRAHGHELAVTASFGVAEYAGQGAPDELIEAADQALYEAKAAGRNCVRTSHASAHA